MSDVTGRRTVPDSARRRPRRAWVEQDVLDAATRCFEQRGYAATSIQDIATEAGLTKGAVYSNFSSKLDLFAAVFSSRSTAFTERALEGLDPAADVARSIEHVAHRLTDILINEPTWHLLASEFALIAARDPEAFAAYSLLRERRITVITDVLASIATAHQFDLPAKDARRTAEALIALLNGLAVESVAAPRPADLASILTLTIRGHLPAHTTKDKPEPR